MASNRGEIVTQLSGPFPGEPDDPLLEGPDELLPDEEPEDEPDDDDADKEPDDDPEDDPLLLPDDEPDELDE